MKNAIIVSALVLFSGAAFASTTLTEDQFRQCARNAKIIDSDFEKLDSTRARLETEQTNIRIAEGFLLTEKGMLESNPYRTRAMVNDFNYRKDRHLGRVDQFNRAADAYNRAKRRVQAQHDTFVSNCVTNKTAPTEMITRVCNEVGTSEWCRSWR